MPVKATLTVGWVRSSLLMVRVSDRLPTAVGSKLNVTSHVSPLLAAMVFAVLRSTGYDSLLLMMLTIWKFVPFTSWMPFVGIVRTDSGLVSVIVSVWVVDALPGPSSTTWPKLID